MGLKLKYRKVRNEIKRILRKILRLSKKRVKDVKPIIASALSGIVQGSVAILQDRTFKVFERLAKRGWTSAKKGREHKKWIVDMLKEEAAGVGEDMKANAKTHLEKSEVELVHLLLYRWWKNEKK